MREACVYRAFDEKGVLLYVGCTYTFEVRRPPRAQIDGIVKQPVPVWWLNRHIGPRTPKTNTDE